MKKLFIIKATVEVKAFFVAAEADAASVGFRGSIDRLSGWLLTCPRDVA